MKVHYYSTFMVILLAVAFIAAAVGFVCVDSWNYLEMAQSLRAGHGCDVDGQYFGIFPCGYPMVIALTAPSANIVALLVSSKFTNFFLLAAGFLLLAKEVRNVFVVTVIFLNPLTLYIYQWTWSENLFLFACCGVIFSIARLARDDSKYLDLVLLTIFLLIGCLSRYVFGPFAVVIFLAIGITYGLRLALRVLPSFVVAALVFLAYQQLNIALTGYGTGMARIPAPETLFYLSLQFAKTLGYDLLIVAAAILAFLLLSTKRVCFSNRSDALIAARGIYTFLFLIGVGYLLLAFLFRVFFKYDMYDERTIGYGIVFIGAALTGWFVRARSEPCYPVLPLLLYGLFLVPFTQIVWTPDALTSIFDRTYKSPAQAIAEYHSPLKNAQVVFSFVIPQVLPYVSERESLYYGKRVEVISLDADLDLYPETLPQLLDDIRKHSNQACVFDFTPFESREEFSAYLEEGLPIGFDSSDSRGLIIKPGFDQSLKVYMLRVFRAGRYVSCADVLRESHAG